MTIPARYTLTEAHFRIAELEKQCDRLIEQLDAAGAENARLREQRDALRADYGDALKEVDELLDLMDAGQEHIEPHDPIAPFLSAGWQCPVCDRRGNLHDERCLVLEIAAVARRRKNGNRRLVVTNGRLRARAEAAEARCVRLEQALEEREDERLQLRAAFYRLQDQLERAYECCARPSGTCFDPEVLTTSVPGSSASDVDGSEKRVSAARGHHESVGERQGRQPGTGEIAGLLVELSRWSRVAELNGDLHARIASALAGPDTPACDHEWVDARNSAVESGELCIKCNALRAGNS